MLQYHDCYENCSRSHRSSWNLRCGYGLINQARITPGRCLLASIKFPPFGELPLLVSVQSPVAFSGDNDSDVGMPSWISVLNENGNVGYAARDLAPIYATTFPPSYLSTSSLVPESIPAWLYGIALNLFLPTGVAAVAATHLVPWSGYYPRRKRQSVCW